MFQHPNWELTSGETWLLAGEGGRGVEGAVGREEGEGGEERGDGVRGAEAEQRQGGPGQAAAVQCSQVNAGY